MRAHSSMHNMLQIRAGEENGWRTFDLLKVSRLQIICDIKYSLLPCHIVLLSRELKHNGTQHYLLNVRLEDLVLFHSPVKIHFLNFKEALPVLILRLDSFYCTCVTTQNKIQKVH